MANGRSGTSDAWRLQGLRTARIGLHLPPRIRSHLIRYVISLGTGIPSDHPADQRMSAGSGVLWRRWQSCIYANSGQPCTEGKVYVSNCFSSRIKLSTLADGLQTRKPIFTDQSVVANWMFLFRARTKPLMKLRSIRLHDGTLTEISSELAI